MGRQKVWHLGVLLKKNLMANERKREHVEEQSCQCWLDQVQMQNRHRLRCCSAQVCVDLDLYPQRKTLFSPTQFKQHATTQARLAHGEGICNTIDSLYLEIVCNRARSKRATNQQEKCCGLVALASVEMTTVLAAKSVCPLGNAGCVLCNLKLKPYSVQI